ncbi:MAG: aspartate--tRNA ligase [Bacteroidetes bacterium]|nr:MAG: aspartate--tRNA ligase [Bacteroidota bacterium]
MTRKKYRTHTCGELKIDDVNKVVVLSGWVQKSRDLGGMTFIDLRDRYGITQLVFNMETDADLCNKARKLGREYVVQVNGTVTERSNKNNQLPTGDIEIVVESFQVLSKSEIPPFTIEKDTDGGEELRMNYRYLDLRREPLKKNIQLRYKLGQKVRNYLDSQNFIEIETPYLIKSTPEGARDFVVPSRMNQGQFYALPQSPQTFKQLLMIAGYDKYFQLVKCFRDEDLRADRQPEFTQIDCEMSFVDQEDVLQTFEGLVKYIFSEIKGIDFDFDFPRISYEVAMRDYGSDKPDLRFGMKLKELTDLVKGKGFRVFDQAEYIGGICVPSCGNYSRKQLDKLTAFVTQPQVGAKGMVYVKRNEDGSISSPVNKLVDRKDLIRWRKRLNAKKEDLLLILSGDRTNTLSALSALRLEMGNRLGLLRADEFKPLWVVDFPLLEWDEESKRFHAKHHPFTSVKEEDIPLLEKDPASVRANAYDLVINGVEVGGGSIRIHEKEKQQAMFKHLGFTDEQAEKQFGFLMNAFKYGAPPHGGIAFGFDRFAALLGGSESIRDYIAFPKNNSGRDIMIESPSEISGEQLKELNIFLSKSK